METREKPAAQGGLDRETGGLRIHQYLEVRHSTGTGEEKVNVGRD